MVNYDCISFILAKGGKSLVYAARMVDYDCRSFIRLAKGGKSLVYAARMVNYDCRSFVRQATAYTCLHRIRRVTKRAYFYRCLFVQGNARASVSKWTKNLGLGGCLRTGRAWVKIRRGSVRAKNCFTTLVPGVGNKLFTWPLLFITC